MAEKVQYEVCSSLPPGNYLEDLLMQLHKTPNSTKGIPSQQSKRRQEDHQEDPRSRSLDHGSHLPRALFILQTGNHSGNTNGQSQTPMSSRKTKECQYVKLTQGKLTQDHSALLTTTATTTATCATSSLASKDHSRVIQYLQSLSNEELLNLGIKLGLRYNTLKKINPDSLLNSMVHAWLRRDDDVIDASGEPSWKSLVKALEDCSHNGIVSEIRQYITDEDSVSQPIRIVNSKDRFQALDENDETDVDDPYEDCKRFRIATAESTLGIKENKLMQEHISYHQAISGEEAEQRLKECGDHCYLTRYSETKECYMLTIYKKKPEEKVKHFRIYFEHSNEQNIYKINGKNKDFNGITEMLSHYEKQRIDPTFETIGRSITEREYMEAKFTADKVKQQELEEELQEAKMKCQQAELQLVEVQQEKQKLEKRLEDMERQCCFTERQCCCTIL